MKKRILIIAEYDLTSKGGIQFIIESITKNLANKYDFDIVVFTHMTVEEKSKYKQYKNIYCLPCNIQNKKIIRILENLTRPFRILKLARKLFKENSYAVVHGNDTLKAPLLFLEAKRKKVPIIIMQCHNPLKREKVSFLKGLYYKSVTSLVNITTNVKIGCSKDACKSTFKKDFNKSFVVNNSIDLKRFSLKKYKKIDDTINFIHVGRFTYQKNHKFLLEVFYKIYKKYSKVNLTLIGWGELEEDIHNQIDKLELNNVVKILPSSTDVSLAMREADYMIFPSRYEGLGIALIEAQSMEVMCFASDCIPKETDLGLCDYLAINSGVENWANYIINFISKDLRKNKKLDKIKQSKFDIKNVIKVYSDIYEGVYCE